MFFSPPDLQKYFIDRKTVSLAIEWPGASGYWPNSQHNHRNSFLHLNPRQIGKTSVSNGIDPNFLMGPPTQLRGKNQIIIST